MNLIELVNDKLPFELSNIVFSFLGESPSSTIINDAIRDMTFNLEYMEDQKQKLERIGFFNVWKTIVEMNEELNQIRTKQLKIISIAEVRIWYVSQKCEKCLYNCSLDEILKYDRKCECCYADELGCDEDDEYY